MRTILIERHPDGEYAAIDEANNDLGWPVGYGKTKRAAIDDLIAQMDERVSDKGWTEVHRAEVNMTARVTTKEEFDSLFPQLPALPNGDSVAHRQGC
jgi:hypothetical protein